MGNPRIKDEAGHVYGKWTVLRKFGNRRGGAAIWECRCQCGTVAQVTGTDLRSGKSAQCKQCALLAIGEKVKTHGQTGTRVYRIWKAMRVRCNDKNAREYNRYGGRGIHICDEWNEFSSFSNWAYANGYSDSLSIDRVDNDGSYSPTNCRWADKKTQSRNRGDYINKRADGVLWIDVAAAHGISMVRYYGRLNEGWSREEASTVPLGIGRTPNWRACRLRDEGGRYTHGAVNG